MSAGGEWAKLAIGLAADVVSGLVERGKISEAERAAEEQHALERLLKQPDPKLLGDAYAAAKAKGPAT